MAKKKVDVSIYAADIETTTLKDIEGNPKEVICYAWGIMNIGIQSNYKVGRTISELLESILSLKNNSQVFFHNLSFDGSYLLNEMLKLKGVQLVSEGNYYFNNDLEDFDIEKADFRWKRFIKSHVEVEHDGRFLQDFVYFRPFISDMGQWYRIEVLSGKKGSKTAKRQVILDSCKLLNMELEKVATDFLGEKVGKTDYDYDKIRYPSTYLTKEEWGYLHRDIEILAKALYELKVVWGIKKNTIASAALDDFKKRLKDKYKDIQTDDIFRLFYPELDKDEHNFITRSYKGGVSYTNPLNQNQIIESTDESPCGMVLDCNSMYPAQMKKPLPIGKGVYYEGKYEKDDIYDLYVQRIRCKFKLKDRAFPMMMLKSRDLKCKYNLSNRIPEIVKSNEYLSSSENKKIELVLNNIDLEVFLDNYDVKEEEIDYIDGYKYRSVVGMFDDYIDYWGSVKAEAVKEKNSVKKGVSKLFMNGLYGKFGSKTYSAWKFCYLKEDVLKFKTMKSEIVQPVYMPVASFITGYGRQSLVKVIQESRKVGFEKYGPDFDVFCYCDTDSEHILLKEEDIKDTDLEKLIDDGTTIGMWKKEEDVYKALYLRSKTYLEQVVDEKTKFKYLEEMKKDKSKNFKIYSTACAGLPKKQQKKLTFENFYLGAKFEDSKLLPKQVKNGVALVSTDFSIKE